MPSQSGPRALGDAAPTPGLLALAYAAESLTVRWVASISTCVAWTLHTRPGVDPPSDRDICEILAAYFGEHPNAMDTPEGIVEWWLPRYSVRISVERMARALAQLEERGLIERMGDGERRLFRLCRDSRSRRRDARAQEAQETETEEEAWPEP